MLFAFIVRVSLWVFFGAVIIVVGTALSIDIGIVDWIFGTGDNARTMLHDVLGFLNRHLSVNKANIELALKIIGLAATITFGALGLLRAFLHGYANLPARLEDYASRIRASHIDGRPVLLAPYAARNLRGDQTPPEPPGIWKRTLRLLGLDAHLRAVRRVMRTRERLDGDLQVLNAVLRLRKTERVTVHLVEGHRIAAEARCLPDGSPARQDRNRAALAEFERRSRSTIRILTPLKWRRAKLVLSIRTPLWLVWSAWKRRRKSSTGQLAGRVHFASTPSSSPIRT